MSYKDYYRTIKCKPTEGRQTPQRSKLVDVQELDKQWSPGIKPGRECQGMSAFCIVFIGAMV